MISDRKENALHQAAKRGDIQTIQQLLDSRTVNLNKIDSTSSSSSAFYNGTPLKIAVESNQKDAISLLIESNADLELRSPFGLTSCRLTPLQIASKLGYLDIVKLLVQAKANIEANSDEGTPLILAAGGYHDEPSVAQYLLENNANINAKSELWGTTALMNAVLFDRKKIVNFLISVKEKKLEAVDNDGKTALHIAAFYGRVEIIKALLEGGANIEVTDSSGDMPINAARLNANHIEQEVFNILQQSMDLKKLDLDKLIKILEGTLLPEPLAKIIFEYEIGKQAPITKGAKLPMASLMNKVGKFSEKSAQNSNEKVLYESSTGTIITLVDDEAGSDEEIGLKRKRNP